MPARSANGSPASSVRHHRDPPEARALSRPEPEPDAHIPLPITYRPEIDGLRAWAVGLVVAFHAGLASVPGGYFGVDVFFVISGYLITRLIAGEAEAGRFSILRFYERRVRRIIPALTAMMVVTLLAGALFVLPTTLARMSEKALAALAFVSNIHFWRAASNYFAPAAELDPFLHTWSLAVEEQFYIVFPPVFAFVFRWSRRLLVGLVLLGISASLALAEAGNSMAPMATFFLPRHGPGSSSSARRWR